MVFEMEVAVVGNRYTPFLVTRSFVRIRRKKSFLRVHDDDDNNNNRTPTRRIAASAAAAAATEEWVARLPAEEGQVSR